MVEFTIFIPHMAVYFNQTFTISNVDKPIVAKVFAQQFLQIQYPSVF